MEEINLVSEALPQETNPRNPAIRLFPVLSLQRAIRRFFMSSKLDNTRVNRDVNNYVQEIIQHLMAVEGSEVELTLEVSVNAPNGIPSGTVRTVSENCRTLKITNFGFDN